MHSVKVNWKEEMQFEAEGPGGKLTLDAAEQFGGKGKGNRSKPLMLISLAGCTGMDVMSLIRKMRLEVENVWIEVKGELTDEHPKKYKKTHVTYHFEGSNLNREKLEKAVDLSFDSYCGVIAMFKSFSEVSREVVFHG